MRVLVTGAGGFVGMSVMDALKARGYQPIGVIRPHSESNKSAPTAHQHELRHLDLRDAQEIQLLVEDTQPEYIIHAGAITPTLEMEQSNPLQVFETNQLSTMALLQAAAATNLRRFVLISSAAVYKAGTRTGATLAESSELNLSGGMYALTKIGSEQLCDWATRNLGLDTRVVRLGPVYGTHERPTSSRTRMSLVHQAVALACDGVPIRCNNPEAVYDWIYSADAAAGIMAILENESIMSRVFNLAGPNVPMVELLDTIRTVIPSTKIEWVETSQANLVIPNGYRRAALDTKRILAETTYRPAYSLHEGIKSYLSSINIV